MFTTENPIMNRFSVIEDFMVSTRWGHWVPFH